MMWFEDVSVCTSHVPEDHEHDIHGKADGMSPVAGC